jgi:Ca-activated chloride channel family protein
VLFNNQSRVLTPGYTNATLQAVLQYGREIANIQPGSGTNLYAGLKQGLRALDAERTSGIVLVTDGVANVGETQQRKFIELIREKDTRLFTFIMGNSANRPLLEAMAKASGGFAASISNSDDIVGQLLNAVSKVTHEALHGVELQIEGVKTANLTPTRIGSLYRGQQLLVIGHYWNGGLADVALRGEISGTGKTYRTQFEFPALATENPELERLWGFAAVEDMQAEMEDFGEQADLKEAATDIALEYGLVTDFTSMLVLREEQFSARSIERRNQRRRTVEQAAQQQRAQRAPVSRRVDQQQPMYHSSRPSHSGGSGALDVWSLLLVLPLLAVFVRARRAQRKTV